MAWVPINQAISNAIIGRSQGSGRADNYLYNLQCARVYYTCRRCLCCLSTFLPSRCCPSLPHLLFLSAIMLQGTALTGMWVAYIAASFAGLCKICREDRLVLCWVPAAIVLAVIAGQVQTYMPACYYVRLSDECTSGGKIWGGRMAAPPHVYLHFHGSAAIWLNLMLINSVDQHLATLDCSEFPQHVAALAGLPGEGVFGWKSYLWWHCYLRRVGVQVYPCRESNACLSIQM